MNEWIIHCCLIMTLFLTSCNCDETTQQYLQSAVRSLKNLRQIQSFRRGDVAHIKQAENVVRRSHQYEDDIPPLSLTKGELASLYEKAVSKGETIQLDTGNEYTHAVIHHLDEDSPSESHPSHTYDDHPKVTPEAGEDAGYYYYYYPLKSFLDEMAPPSSGSVHNVTIQTAEKDKTDAKPMEPLFMAISGFIGMAVMFMLSMVVIPKFGNKPKVNDIKKKEKLDDFARFALNAIEGNCAERFACELTKSARSFDIEDNRFYKLLKRMAPGTFGRLMNNAGKYANKQLKCTAIPCTKKRPNNNNNNKSNNSKNNNNRKNTNNNNQKKKNNANKKH